MLGRLLPGRVFFLKFKHVCVEVDFSTEHWYEKVEKAGYDPSKKSIYLWDIEQKKAPIWSLLKF